MIDQEKRSGVKRANVKIERLDDLVQEHSLKAPDFLKIDTEGAELDVVTGGERTIRTHRPTMYIEMHGADMAQKMMLQKDVHALLNSWGYTMQDLRGKNVLGSSEHAGHILCTPEPS